MKRYIAAAGIAALGFAGLAHAGGGITINEVRIDNGGTDTDEYFELNGPAGASLDGYSYIVLGDDSGDGSGDFGKRSGNIEFVFDLTGMTIPADGFFLAISDAHTLAVDPGQIDTLVSFSFPNSFENGDNVTHMLVQGFTGAIDDVLDPDRNGSIDITPWSSVADAISLIETSNPPSSNSNEWDYHTDPAVANSGIGPDGSFVPGHAYRSLDGSSAWAIGDFGLALGVGPADSPGTSNVPTPGALALLGVAGLAGARRRR